MSIRVGTHDNPARSARTIGTFLAAVEAMNATTAINNEHYDRSARYSGVPHNNANRRKKSKRKQAQASRRNNRR